jgi:hypothetical protein
MKTMFVLLSFAVIANAQPPDSLWSRTYGGTAWETCEDVRQTEDGGYILVGETNSFGAGGYDAWMVKTDAVGDSLWSRTYGGSGVDGFVNVRQTSDGGYLIAGNTSSFGAGNTDMWLVKTDANGDSLWTQTYGGNGDDVCRAMQVTSSGDIVLAGGTHSFGAGGDDFWLVNTDANGDSLRSRTFGGVGDERAFSVQQAADGGYALAGFTTSFGAGGDDMWLVKTDANADSLWSRTFGYGGSGGQTDECYAMQQTSDGGYVLGGMTGPFAAHPYREFWVVKTDANGDSVWSHTYGGSRDDRCRAMQVTSGGDIVLAGWTGSFGAGINDMWLVKTNANGDSLWSRTFGGADNDGAESVEQTSDGGYVVAGVTISFGAGNEDMWLVKTGPDGPPVPHAGISVTPTLLNFASVFVGDSTTLPMVIHSTGDTSLVVSSVTAPQDFHTDFVPPQTLAPGESLVVNVTFAPTEAREYDDTLFVMSNAPDNAVAVRVTGTGLVDAAGETPSLPKEYALHPVYPNPFNATATIRYDLPVSSPVKLTLFDVLGKEVALLVDGISPAGTHTVSFDATDLPSGVYLCRFEAGSFAAVQKLMLIK